MAVVSKLDLYGSRNQVGSSYHDIPTLPGSSGPSRISTVVRSKWEIDPRWIFSRQIPWDEIRVGSQLHGTNFVNPSAVHVIGSWAGGSAGHGS